MPKKPTEELVLKCETCGEFLHVQIVSEDIDRAGRRVRRHRQELFCPNCGQPRSLIHQFKSQKYAQKK
jgi:hypothetical protein